MNIQINTLIEWHVDEGKYPIERVLWIDDDNTHVWMIDIKYSDGNRLNYALTWAKSKQSS